MEYTLVIAAALTILFLPRVGLVVLFRKYRAAQKREIVEDALKHLLDRERNGGHGSVELLAGSLRLPRSAMTTLIEEMETQGLLESHGTELHLTADGERWALHIVRAHRLWERYLADEARMPLDRIHGEAQKREHEFTEARLNELDAALGHPTRDPHGDPIPTREGKMNRVEGTPLTEWPAGRPARIVHLEDEPVPAYQQILAAGLRLGQDIRIIEKDQNRYILSDGENEIRLAPAAASNVHVSAVPEKEMTKREAIRLAELADTQTAEIVTLDEAVQGFTRRRFLDLGLTPGARIYPELGNFFGDPRAYRIRGTLIALRKDQAAQIWVKPI
jgi:DtxR family Mn-dependent transcriptional regulator